MVKTELEDCLLQTFIYGIVNCQCSIVNLKKSCDFFMVLELIGKQFYEKRNSKKAN